MNLNEAKPQLDLLSRAGAFLLVALYGVGFLVVSFADASRGVEEFGLFRAKLLSAGVLFSILLALPVLQFVRAFGLLGFAEQAVADMRSTDTPLKAPAWCIRAYHRLSFFNAAWATGFWIQIIFGKFDFSRAYLIAYVAFLGVSVAVVMLVEKHFSRRPMLAPLVSALMIFLGMSLLALLRKWQPLLVLVWFLWVGSFADDLDSITRSSGNLRHINWLRLLIGAIGTIGLFTVTLYPRVPPVFGGGQPLKVVLQFANASPIDSSKKTNAWLVGEVDSGYYVVQNPDDHKAIFIPRSSVSAVYFEPNNPIFW